jgi:glyoxylase-like metal-dependent hydrolase (beta-lactamase superfamily II)
MATMRIGAIEVATVSDGLLKLDPGRMFGPEQPAEWRELVHTEEGRIPMSVNCVLVRIGERRILLDTGTGNDDPVLMERYGGQSGRLVENLQALGVQPTDVDTVVISHAHGDHVGGATVPAGDGMAPTFPKASYWIWRGEWEYWTTPESLEQAPHLKRKLPPLAEHGRLELVDSEMEVAPGVRLIASPGHTPGHICVALTSGREMAIYTGDLLHHAAQFDHPEWSPAFDLLPQLSAESRRRILEQAVRDRALLLTAHLPTPGIARPDNGGWRLGG